MEHILRTEIVLVPIEKLVPFEDNAKLHPPEQIESIAAMIAEDGFDQPCVIDQSFGIGKGHGRYLASLLLRLTHVPCIFSDVSAERFRALRLADNRVAETGWDKDKLRKELRKLAELKISLPSLGFKLPEIRKLFKGEENPFGPEEAIEPRATLADRFLIPPFSLFDARQGYWQDRKRLWLALGIKSELGRGGVIASESPNAYASAQDRIDGVMEKYKQQEQGGGLDSTLGAVPSNQRSILKRTGKYE